MVNNVLFTLYTVVTICLVEKDVKYLLLSYLQAGEITRRLQEEEEAAMGSANAIKKLDAEIKRSKEEVENMDLRRVICTNISSVVEF